MKKQNLTIVLTISLLITFCLSALADKNKPKPDEQESISKPTKKEEKSEPEIVKQPVPEEKPIPQIKPATKEEPVIPEMRTIDVLPQQNYELPWSSVNGGGEINMTSTNFKMKSSSGQAIIGQMGSSNYKIGIGFWYGVAPQAPPCVDAIVGDLALPLNGNRTPADVVTLINTVFKSRPLPVGVNPCAADVNQSGGPPSPADVVTLINNVFKSKPLPSGDRCGC